MYNDYHHRFLFFVFFLVSLAHHTEQEINLHTYTSPLPLAKLLFSSVRHICESKGIKKVNFGVLTPFMSSQPPTESKLKSRRRSSMHSLDTFEAFLCGSIFAKTVFCLGEKQAMLVNDECSSWCNRVGDF